MSQHDGKTEIRFELPVGEVGVLDGYVQATGKSRADVLRAILGDWSRDRLHESTLICRVAGVNPFASEDARK